MDQGTQLKTRRKLRDIDPSAWEHPADKAALQALRRIPVFDEVLKKLFCLFGEKPIATIHYFGDLATGSVVACIPPTTTCRRWSGNSDTITTIRHRQPRQHSHGIRLAGGSPRR